MEHRLAAVATPRTQVASKDIPLESEALRVNIAGTRHEAPIPDEYLPLVQAVEDLYGVREPLRETLREYFHPMRSEDAVIDGLQTAFLRNWPYLERSEERLKLFSLLTRPALELLRGRLTHGQASLLLRVLLQWVLNTERGGRAAEYDEAVERLATELAGIFPSRPLPFLERDALLRQAAAPRLARRPDLVALAELYRAVLTTGYSRGAERLDVPAWALSREAHLTNPGAVSAAFAGLQGDERRALAAEAAEAPGIELLSGRFPTFSALLDQAIANIFQLDDLEDRFLVCLFFLKDDTLGYRQHEVMVHLLGAVKVLLEPQRTTDFNRLLGRLTRFFHRRENLFPEMRFLIYQAVGEAIGQAGASRAADHLIGDLLSWRFEHPDIGGATDEWRTIVNPYHLPNVRCWLGIIESNPLLYERLAAALNVQLRLGGVFISDTDLFQRDVTRLLNADIRPIYFVVKQLLRTLPVYFNELGAEGELRSVSTEVDEVLARRDTLMHYLRKQVHAESSNRLIDFNQAILEYWAYLDPNVLQPYLSPNTLAAVAAERELAEGPHRLLVHLAADCDGGDPACPLAELRRLPPDLLEAHLAGVPDVGWEDRRRLALIVRQDQLLREKYSLDSGDLAALLEQNLQAPEAARRTFRERLGLWESLSRAPEGERPESRHLTPSRDGRVRDARDSLLDAALDVLEALKGIVLAPEPSTGIENIYHKRHIAAGVPSMYGNYREAKFDALALSFRVEGLVSRLLDEEGGSETIEQVTVGARRRFAALLRRFERALGADGVHSRNLSGNIGLLEASQEQAAFSFRQHQNVVQFLAQSVSDLARISILSHDEALREILEHDSRPCELRGLGRDAVAEVVLRDVLVSSLGLQTLDRYVADAVRANAALAEHLTDHALTAMMHYDPDRLISWIHHPDEALDDQVTVGYKALGLKHLAGYGHQVPEGFILTTELFGTSAALDHPPLLDDTLARLREALHDLEERSGRRLGDPARPLLLSIRSGAAVSMPGLMLTFVNVGLNDELTERLAAHPPSAWTAWDSYRRYLQSWAMSAGIERDVFDDLMGEFKRRYQVGPKLEFTGEQMRELALAYKAAGRERGVVFPDDPFDQVVACVRTVLASWDSEQARLFRSYMGMAEEWGTAVIIQRMVFGNRGRGSGAGVTFTRNPRQPHTRLVRLYGDFAVGGQGEDLVGGLVFPLPISEAQRKGSPSYRDVEQSLESDFPEIYQGLLEVARDLVTDREYDPQEIEFTFESPRKEDLYILQKRPMVGGFTADLPVFDMRDCDYCDLPAAVGVGVSGGAYAGRVAVSMEHIDRLLAEDPDGPIVLLRPDTVPEDLAMIVRVTGILTARGGSTSHAAVTAKRLGKVAVVDCRALTVREREGRAILAGRELRAGDWVSIDGRTGHIYIAKLQTFRPREGGPRGERQGDRAP